MNHFKGWIKLYRSLSEKGWYVKSEYVHFMGSLAYEG